MIHGGRIQLHPTLVCHVIRNEVPPQKRAVLDMARKVLLVCGVLASLLYVGADILAAMRH